MKQAMEQGGFNETTLALRLGVNKRTLNNYLNNNTEPKYEVMLDFCEIIGTSIEQIVRKGVTAPRVPELQRVTDQDDLIKIDVIDAYVSAGPGAVSPTENVIGQIAFEASWLDREGIKPTEARIVSVEGDSMEPLIDNGSFVMIDLRRRSIVKKGVYAVRLGDANFIKEVEFRWITIGKEQVPEWVLHSANPTAPTQFITNPQDDTFEVLGKVVWVSKVWPHDRY